ncbi:MAG: hypothetical protein ACLFS3_01535 [Candidatus Aenigmatarchaeota archaeon]
MSKDVKGWDVEIDGESGLILDEYGHQVRACWEYIYTVLHGGQVKRIEQIEPIEETHKLLGEHENEVEPKGACLSYIFENVFDGDLERDECYQISKEEFNTIYKNNEFRDGEVFRDDFGTGYGEPYSMNPQAFGRLKTGQLVYCDLWEDFDE